MTSPISLGAEMDQFRSFIRERFRSEPEAAAFLGGPAGIEALLSFDEFARALRISGYRRSPDRLFQLVGEGGVVSVRDLLRDSGLPTEPQSSIGGMLVAPDAGAPSPTAAERSALMPIEEAGMARLERQLMDQVETLRLEVSQLRLKADDAAPREALLEERSGREIGEEAMRQLSMKLEEALARETVALRADNADLRASLTESLRLLAEERKERQTDTAEAAKRLKDLQNFTEERTQRLEGLARGVQTQVGENRTSLQEVEQLREMSEFRVLASVAEESRAREAAIQREQQAREAMCAEIEQRWRVLLNEERTLRNKENDALALQLGRCEDALRAEREVQTQRNSDFASRLDDIVREIRDEIRARQSETMRIQAQVDELRTAIRSEAEDRRL